MHVLLYRLADSCWAAAHLISTAGFPQGMPELIMFFSLITVFREGKNEACPVVQAMQGPPAALDALDCRMTLVQVPASTQC